MFRQINYSPVGNSFAEVSLPASKSISNRLLIMNYLSGRKIRINNLSEADDTELMTSLLGRIDHQIRQNQTHDLCELDCGNAGTVMRFLMAFLCLQPGNWLLTGSQRMRQRPVRSLFDALQSLGASIEYLGKEGYPPLKISGSPLKGGCVQVDASRSSQYISALLMIAPLLEGGLQISLQNTIASRPYIQMTLALMKKAGIIFQDHGDMIAVKQGVYNETTFFVEPDWSSASYWYEAVALIRGQEILLKGLSLKSLQGDAILADIFSKLGVGSHETRQGIIIRRISNPEEKFTFNFTDCPDLVPAIAASCAALNIDATLTGLTNLQIKESNRLEALYNELSKIQPGIEVSAEGVLDFSRQLFPVIPPELNFKTYNDHRMAMALAPLAVISKQVYIENPGVVAKSYPSFWADMNQIGFHIQGN